MNILKIPSYTESIQFMIDWIDFLSTLNQFGSGWRFSKFMQKTGKFNVKTHLRHFLENVYSQSHFKPIRIYQGKMYGFNHDPVEKCVFFSHLYCMIYAKHCIKHLGD